MSDEAAFLRAIAAAPDDDAPRLVFADWLDDRGDVRSTWVRDLVIWRWMRPDAGDPLPRLAAALGERETWVAVSAAFERLGEVAVPVLQQLALTAEGDIQSHALSILGKSRSGQGMLPDLLRRLASDDADVRRSALRPLESLGPNAAPALSSLLLMLDDPDWQTVLSVVNVIGSLGTTATSAVPVLVATTTRARGADEDYEEWQLVWVATVGVLASLGPASEDAILTLVNALGHEDAGELARSALVRLGPSVVETLLREGCGFHEDDQWALIDVLAELAPDSLPAILHRIVDPKSPTDSKELAVGTLVYLAELGRPIAHPEVLPVLIQALSHSVVSVKAAEALGHLSEAARLAVPALLATLVERLQSDEYAEVHATTLATLGESSAAFAAVLPLARHEIASFRAEVMRVLGRLVEVPGVTAVLIEGLRDPIDPVRERAAWSLSEGSASLAEHVPALRQALDDPDWLVRRGVVKAFGHLGHAAADTIPDLLRHLRDPDHLVVGDVVNTLGRLGPDVPGMIEAVRTTLDSPERVGMLSVIASWQSIPAELGPELARFLSDEDWSTRRCASDCLFRLTEPRPDDPAVRDAVLAALPVIRPEALEVDP